MGRMKKSRANNFMKQKNKAAASKRKAAGEEDFSDGMDDEIDKFHKSREEIHFEDSDSEDEEFENPVFDLKGSGSDNEEEEDDEDEDVDDRMAAKIEKQLELLKKRRGAVSEETDEEEASEEEKNDWGKSKRNYYRPPDELQSSDEEGPALEEAEARRLQQKEAQRLRPEDFEQDDADEEDDTLEKLVEKENQPEETKSKVELDSNISLEKVKKDLSSLSRDEKLQVVMSNAPELVGLLNELKAALHELEHKVHPLLKKIEDGKIESKEGKNYAELKHMIYLSYCQSIVFYLLLKSEGRSVCDHPVIARLVEIRTLLEKVRLLDKKLEPQVEKFMLLDTSSLPASEPMKKVQSTKPLGTQPEKTNEAPAPQQKEAFIGEESRNMLREMERLEEKAKRDQLLGATEAKPKRPGKRQAGLLDDLQDDLGADELPKKLSQVIAEAGRRQKKPKIISGDVDLPVKEDIGERRRKHEMKKPLQNEADDEEFDHSEEDEVYKEAKALKLQKQAARASTRSRDATTPEEDAPSGGKRLITNEMEKNRGLTPYRKKASKNPRKKYKTKHGKAVIRRKGQVRDLRHQTGPYEGEPTGIRTNLSRSIRFS